MEHLFFNPDQEILEHEAARILDAAELKCDWEQVLPLNHDLSLPVYTWHLSDHDNKPVGKKWTAFEDYPKTRGWQFAVAPEEGSVDTGELSHGKKCSVTNALLRSRGSSDGVNATKVVGLLQSWLILGLLEAVCQCSISSTYLTRPTASGTLVVDSRNLTFLLYAQKIKLSKLNAEERKALYWYWHLTTATYKDVFHNLLAYLEHDTPDFSEARTNSCWVSTALRHTFSLAVQVWEIMIYALHSFASMGSERILCGPTRRNHEKFSADMQLLNAGFCSTLLHQQEIDSLSVWHWLAWWAKTTTFTRLEDHSACTKQSCTLDNTPDVPPQHTLSCQRSTCRFIAPPISEITEVIDAGMFPLLRIKTHKITKALQLSVEAVSDPEFCVYIAFSHVWRHGLGSTTETGLPECQIYSLLNILAVSHCQSPPSESDFFLSTLFWIDSLCIPAASRQRKLAIQGINTVFRESSEVIVLDKSLFLTTRLDTPTEFMLAAVVCSAWQTRLWTWLEGYLAQSLSFATDDCMYEVRLQRKPLSRLHDFPLMVPLHMGLVAETLLEASKLWSSVSSFSTHQQSLGRPGRDLFRKSAPFLATVKYRSTTKPDDEPIILATALGLDLAPLTAYSGDARMRAFYLELGELPANWLFLGLPRLSISSFGWAPRTLLLRHALLSYYTFPSWREKYCEVTTHGLYGSFTVVMLGQVHDGLKNYGLYRFKAINDDSAWVYGELVSWESPFKSRGDYDEDTAGATSLVHNMLIFEEEPYDPPEESSLRVLLALSVSNELPMVDAQQVVTSRICGFMRMRIGSWDDLPNRGHRKMSDEYEYRKTQRLCIL